MGHLCEWGSMVCVSKALLQISQCSHYLRYRCYDNSMDFGLVVRQSKRLVAHALKLKSFISEVYLNTGSEKYQWFWNLLSFKKRKKVKWLFIYFQRGSEGSPLFSNCFPCQENIVLFFRSQWLLSSKKAEGIGREHNLEQGFLNI